MQRLKTKPNCDPQALGSRCQDCPLFKDDKHLSTPVPDEIRPASRLVILGETPRRADELAGKPFQGSAGWFLRDALKANSLKRSDVSLANTLLCQPPKEFTPDQWHQAIEACRPRLERALANSGAGAIMACGNRSLYVTTGKASVTPWYGAPLPSKYGPVLPSVTLGFVNRKPAFGPVFKRWLARALALARDGLKWAWPQELVTTITDPAIISQRLMELVKRGTPVAVDIENAGDPMTAEMFCIDFSNDVLSVSFPWDLTEHSAVATAMRAILENPVIVKVGQNLQHDELGLKCKGFPLAGPTEDTLLMHAVVAPQLPHGLTDIGAFELEAERWKTDFKVGGEDKGLALFRKAWEKKRQSMLLYNAKDGAGTELIRQRLEPQLDRTHRGHEIYETYKQLDRIAMRMREVGVLVDVDQFASKRKELNEKLAELRGNFIAIGCPEWAQLGASGANPSLARLFFDEFKCIPISYSEETKKPSLDMRALERYGQQQDLIGHVARIVLEYRKYSKLMSSYIDTMPMDAQHVVHPYWRVFGTRTGRWSAQDPALQTIPAGKKKGSISLRGLFRSRPNTWWVSADFNALEARICAIVYKASQLSQWFANDVDVHSRHAEMIFKVEVNKKKNSNLREMAKTILYALAYGSSPETIWSTMVLDNPGIQLSQVILVYNKLREIHYDLAENQKLHLFQCAAQGYVEEPVSGKRQHYLDGHINPNECMNFPIQSLAGHLANRAILGIASELDWVNGETILAQVHDEIALEGPNPERLAGLLTKWLEMPLEAYGQTTVFPCEVSYGHSWGGLQKNLAHFAKAG